MKITTPRAVMFGAFLGAAVAGAQERHDIPTFASKVELVTVDVVVSDKAGSPVPGLTQDDFTVMDEGQSRPIATFDGAKLETFFIGWYLRNAQRFDSVPKLSDARRRLLEVYEGIANDPTLYLDMHFRPGDVQWLRNAFVLHKRTAYDDFDEPEKKRHLLRVWLSAPGIDDSMPHFSPLGGVTAAAGPSPSRSRAPLRPCRPS